MIFLPPSAQFLQSLGGAVGHTEARWPTWSQRRQLPVNSRATAGLGQSAFEWPSSPQLKQPRDFWGSVHSSLRCLLEVLVKVLKRQEGMKLMMSYETYPSCPQLKQGRGLEGSGQSALLCLFRILAWCKRKECIEL